MATVTSGSVADAANSSSLGAVSNLYGTLAGADVDTGNTLTYGISSPTSTNANYTSSASGSSVTYDISKTGTYGTLYVQSTTGKYLYVANAALVDAIPLGSSPTESFTVTVSDGTATTTTGYSVNLTGANEAPTASATNITVVQDNAKTGTLPAATDVDTGDAVTYAAGGTAPSHGTLVVNADGSYTYTPTTSYSGADSFDYTVSDGHGGSNTYTVTVTVTANVAASFAGADTASVTEDSGSYVKTGTLTVTDPDSATTITAQTNTAGTYGSFSIDSSGNWTYTANNSLLQSLSTLAQATETFTVASADGTTHDVVVTLNGVNDAPVFVDPVNTSNTVTSYTFNYAENRATTDVLGTVVATDADGSGVTYAITTNVYLASDTGHANPLYAINGSTGEITLTSAGVAAGLSNDYETLDNSHSLVVTATGTAGSGTALTTDVTITLNETNVNDAAPVFKDGSNNTVTSYTFNYAENRATTDVLGTVVATDADGSGVTYAITTNVYLASDTGHANPLYAINGSTGEITLTSAGVAAGLSNDYETLDNSHSLVVTATGTAGSGTALTTDVTITLNETDVNDTVSAPVTITNVEPGMPGTADDTVVEGNPLIFTATLSGTTATVQEFDFNWGGGTAIAGVDYNGPPTFSAGVSYNPVTGKITVQPGIGSFTVTFTTNDDTVVENIETVPLSIGGIAVTGSISDGADMALTIANITVNEASPFAVFRLDGVEGQRVQLSLQSYASGSAPTGTSPATLGADTGTQIQYFDGLGWQSYTPGAYVVYPNGSTTLLVRVALVNDGIYEGPEAFKLVATGDRIDGTGNSVTAEGVGTIGDDGRGAIFNESGAEDPFAVKDDDRPLRVSNPIVNEGSDYVIFALNQQSGSPMAATLQLLEDAGMIGVPTSSNAANILETQTLQIWSGGGWVNYTGSVSILSGTPLYVRASIVQEQDDIYEGPEIFQLKVTTIASTPVTATGTAEIRDDGTGVIFVGGINGGVPATSIDNLDDDLDKDGIPPNVEEILATLSASSGSGGRPGDLNNDGLPDAEQPSVATLAWMKSSYFQEALSGQLAQVKPIVFVTAVSPDSSTPADSLYQLEKVSVVPQTDARFAGIDPIISNTAGQTIDAPWDPLVFTVVPVNSGSLLADVDPSRAGLQIIVHIDVSRSGLSEGDFNGYLKFVSQSTINAAGGTLRDLDGNPITQAGWYDFLQRRDGNGNYVGDGARFIVTNGKITAIELTFTDNAFGDADMASNRITDPGMPVHVSVTTATAQPFIPPAIPRFLVLDDLKHEWELEEIDTLEQEHKSVRPEPSGIWASKSQFVKASFNHAALKLSDPEQIHLPEAIKANAKTVSTNSTLDLRNTLTPPDAVAGADGRLNYQLPMGTFSGGQGAIRMEATLKDGSPLPSWMRFDGATGKLTATVPIGGAQGNIEIKVQARDSKGQKAETVLQFKPRSDKLSLVGKRSLTAQLDHAMQRRA